MNLLVRRPWAVGAVAIGVALGVVYLANGRTGAADQPAAAAPPAVPVTVQTLVEQKVRVWSEFSGRLRAVDSAEIRPEVGGRITEVRFEDGQTVKAGDVLFVIDPRPYQATVAKADANLATARTNADFAKLEWERASRLVGSQAIAQRIYDERANANRAAAAAVKAAEAELRQAQLDLDHAYVKAPISGRASRAEITVGNLVQPGANAPLLTTIISDQPIYADFDVDEQTYLQSVRDYAKGRDQERLIPVQIALQNGGDRHYLGHIYSFDNRLDPVSGTIRARAKFENRDGGLLPGMFVTVRLASAGDNDEVLVPNRAVSSDQSKSYVYVVGADNKVGYREVVLGKQVGSERIARKGLQAGDRVIVDGLQHVRPDVVVAPRELASALSPDRAPEQAQAR